MGTPKRFSTSQGAPSKSGSRRSILKGERGLAHTLNYLTITLMLMPGMMQADHSFR